MVFGCNATKGPNVYVIVFFVYNDQFNETRNKCETSGLRDKIFNYVRVEMYMMQIKVLN